MDEVRVRRVVRAMAAAEGAESQRLCVASRAVVAVSGAGITLMGSDGAARMTMCTSDHVARAIEELQFSLGEGPCVDAFAEDRPVSESDLARVDLGRWPLFAPAALAAGAVAVFGFPLRVGKTRIGTLNLYRDRAGPLSDDQFADALIVSDLAARQIAMIQSDVPIGVAAESLLGQPGLRLLVHQATGMVAVQLDVAVSEALVRLRARAVATGIALDAVAAAVVTRHARFERDEPAGLRGDRLAAAVWPKHRG